MNYGILAFQATRLNMSKTFANSMKPQAERERDALDWLQSHASASSKKAVSDSDEKMSESESTFAQDNSRVVAFRQELRQMLDAKFATLAEQLY